MSTADNSNPPKPKRRWYQYRLRTLMIFVTLVAVGMSWFAVRMQRVRRQKEAVEAIDKLGGAWIEYKYEFYGSPKWLRKWLGNDFFKDVATIHVHKSEHISSILEHCNEFHDLEEFQIEIDEITDGDLKRISEYKNLRRLEIGHGEKITRVGLRYLNELKELRYLRLEILILGDDDLEQLQDLPNLKELILDFVSHSVTAKGMRHLAKFPRLRKLYLCETNITDEEVNIMRKMNPTLKIGLTYLEERDGPSPEERLYELPDE
jgi:hypothetical protein